MADLAHQLEPDASAPANDTAPPPEVLNVTDACKLLGVSRNTLYAAVSRNEVPHRRIGTSIRFSRTALLKWLDSSAGHAQDR